MSSNNQIVVMKTKKGYEIFHNLCVDNDFVPEDNDIIGKANTMEEAVEIAIKFIRENIVEYGINFIDDSENKIESTNPMDYCLSCNKYLGFRGFCSKKCHDKYYDDLYGSEKKDKGERMKIGNLKSLKPRVFKFKQGEFWDGDEMIIHYLEDILLDKDSKIKQDTYITILSAEKRANENES